MLPDRSTSFHFEIVDEKQTGFLTRGLLSEHFAANMSFLFGQLYFVNSETQLDNGLWMLLSDQALIDE